MNRAAIDLWVGVFVAIGLGAVLFLALKVGNLLTLDQTPSYRVEANFDNIGGLKLRSPVKAPASSSAESNRSGSIQRRMRRLSRCASIETTLSARIRSLRSTPRDCSVKSTWVSMRGATPRC
jgi:hypothetical protein